jgi:hypothetical protein
VHHGIVGIALMRSKATSGMASCSPTTLGWVVITSPSQSRLRCGSKKKKPPGLLVSGSLPMAHCRHRVGDQATLSTACSPLICPLRTRHGVNEAFGLELGPGLGPGRRNDGLPCPGYTGTGPSFGDTRHVSAQRAAGVCPARQALGMPLQRGGRLIGIGKSAPEATMLPRAAPVATTAA